MKKNILISIMFLSTIIYAVYQSNYNRIAYTEKDYCKLSFRLKIYNYNVHTTSLYKIGINSFLEYDLDINRQSIRVQNDDFFIEWIIDAKEISTKKNCDEKEKIVVDGINNLNIKLVESLKIFIDNVSLKLKNDELKIAEIIAINETMNKFVMIDRINTKIEKESSRTYITFILELFYINSIVLILFISINKLILFFKIRKIKII
jgi:hypothetical protein